MAFDVDPCGGRLLAEAFEYMMRLREGWPNGEEDSSVRVESGGFGRGSGGTSGVSCGTERYAAIKVRGASATFPQRVEATRGLRVHRRQRLHSHLRLQAGVPGCRTSLPADSASRMDRAAVPGDAAYRTTVVWRADDRGRRRCAGRPVRRGGSVRRFAPAAIADPDRLWRCRRNRGRASDQSPGVDPGAAVLPGVDGNASR